MSVENNSLRTIDGLNTLFCDTINVVESIEIDGDNGNNNQLLSSDGTKTLWKDLTDLLQNLTVSAPLSFVSGSFYDGAVARAIQIADGAIANGKLANSTISGKQLGTNLETLSFGDGIVAIGGNYNGGSVVGLSVLRKLGGGITVDSNGVSLTNSTISGKELGTNLETLNFDAPLSNLDYNGGTARTITIADGAIGNAKLDNSTISGKELGTNLENLHIGNGLLGVDLTDASSTTEYRGDVNVGIAVNPKGGGGLSTDGSGVFLTNNTISGIVLGGTLTSLLADSPLSFVSGTNYTGTIQRSLQISSIPNNKLANSTISGIALGSNLQNLELYFGLQFLSGTTYNGGTSRTIQTHLKTGGGLSQDGNGITLTDVYKTISDRVHFVDTGVGSERYIFVINAGDWRVNDDSSFYNISIDDEINKVTGRARTMNSSIEAMAVITLPQGWTPTGILVDNRDSGGSDEPEQLDVYKVRNWGGANGTVTDLVGSVTTGTERNFTSSYGAADSEFSLLIKVHLNATTDFLGGGYIVLTAPGGL